MGRTYRQRRTLRSECRGKSLQSFADNIDLVKDLKSKGWMNENHLEPAQFPRTGRGVFSKRAIDSTEALISIPYNALITLTTIEHDLEFKTLFNNDTTPLKGKLSFQSLLAIYLLYRKHHHPCDPYIRSIPISFTNPFFCTKQELLVLPDNLFERIVEQNKQIKDTLNLLLIALRENTCQCCSLKYASEIFTSDALKWAFFAVNSRSVFIDPNSVKRLCQTKHFVHFLRDQPSMALAPFLDLFNHSDTVPANESEFFVTKTAQADTTQLRYTLRVSTSYRPYDQIFISYGTLDNTTLLLEYGFILPQNSHDCVRFAMSDIASFLEANARDRKPINSNKFRFIKENQLDAEMFINRADGLSHNLSVVLTILFVDVAHFNNVLNIVGFGDVQPLEPIAEVGAQFLLHKRRQLERNCVALRELEVGQSSPGGVIVTEYLNESCLIIDCVIEQLKSIN